MYPHYRLPNLGSTGDAGAEKAWRVPVIWYRNSILRVASYSASSKLVAPIDRLTKILFPPKWLFCLLTQVIGGTMSHTWMALLPLVIAGCATTTRNTTSVVDYLYPNSNTIETPRFRAHAVPTCLGHCPSLCADNSSHSPRRRSRTSCRKSRTTSRNIRS